MPLEKSSSKVSVQLACGCIYEARVVAGKPVRLDDMLTPCPNDECNFDWAAAYAAADAACGVQ